MKSFFVLMAFLLVFIPRLAMAQEVPGYQQEKSADNSFKNEAGLTGQMRVDQFSGAASYNIGLEVSPGRSGLNPSLSLFYNSNDKSNDSWVGQGWSLPLGNIQRTSRRGTNNLYTSNEFSLFLNGQSKEIIEIDANNHIFAPKEESDFLKIQYITQSSSWQVTDTMGVKYYFGQTASSRQDDPADQTRIYKWQLDKVEDTNANFYTLSYAKISGQIYPAAINYTGNNASAGPMDITFNLEDRGDDFVSYQTQFAVTTTKRLLDIQIEVDNTLTFKYEFNYTTGQNGSTSLLSSLVKKAYDGQGEHALPATSFAYSTKQTGWTDATNQWPTTTPAFNNYDHPDEAPQLADFNGDSWTDISGAFHTGSDWEGQNWNFPDVDLSKVLIADINGDKLMDIAGYFRGNQRHVGAFLNNGVNGFNYNEAWSNALPEFVNEEISRTAFVDINGDGLADLIHAWHKGNSLTSWMRLNTGTGWSGDYGDFPVDLAYCNPNINNLDCYSLGTQIVDVNGDGLVDVVKDRNVYLNLGTGFEQEPNQQWILPELPNHFEDVWRWGGARLTDLNGDGLLDITIVADSYYNGDHGWDLYRLAASYLNNGSGWQQNNNWNSPIVIGTKGSSGVIDEGVRLMDINNDNAIDVVKSHADQDNNISRQVYLGSSAQGNQLTVITNGYGGQTELSYQPSGRYFTEDDKFANPKLPLNLETVKTITTTDGQDNEITTDYFYKDGAYYADPTDFTLNQYVGFGSVTGQTSDQVARTFYHQGSGVDGYINGEYEDSIYKKGRAYREEVIHDDGEDWHLLSAKVNTWKQEDLDANRKYVYQDSSVTYDYDADGWLLSGPQNAPTANFNPNQATVNGQLSDLVDLQAYAPAVGEQLVSQSEDGLSSTYYLGRNESGHELFRSESKSILGEDEEEPGRDDPAQENFIPQEGDRAIEVYSYNCPHFNGLWEQHQGYSDFNQANVYLTNYQAGQECHLSRISLPFNTSGLPDDATIISANLSMNVFDVDGSMMVYVVNGLDGDVSAGEEHIGSTGGQNFNLNSTGLDWINLTGNTNLGLRGDYDFRNVDLQGALYAIGFNLSESATATRPVLSVEYTLNDPPLVPADLLTEGEENPDDVADQTPEFSAIYNDDNEEDLAVHYQLQVIQAGGSFDNPLWESDDVPLDLASSTPAGMRIEPIQYGGNNLPLEGYKYFWRIKFWDNGDEETAEGAWSDGQDYFYMDGSDAPTAPIDLLVEGRTEPVDLINQRPAFSAIYIDPNPIDRAKWYEIEVDDNNNFSSPIWDSGKTLLATSSLVDNGSRMAEVAYGGENPLPYDGTNYYWRVKFWDDEDANGTEGDWSANGQFGMFNQADALDSVAAKAVKYSYDFDNGNVTDEENFGQVYASPNGIYLNTAEAVVGDEKDFAYAYAEPTQEALHILSAPKSKILLDPITQASSTVAITYDGLNFGQVNKANPTKEDLKVTDVVYNKTFNSYGLVTSAEDPLGNDTTITYDADYYYPYQTTNELNQLTKTEYDLNCGQVKKITDSNNTVEERAYDAFCRITSVKKTNPALSSMLTLQTYEYHVTSTPPYVKQVNYPGQSYGQDIYSYFDGLGRKIQIREEAETANQFRVTSYSYDTKGNLYRQSLPYFDNSSAFEAEAWATPYTQYAYDAQNRVTQQSVVTGQNTYTTSYVYDGWNVTVTDPNNKAKKFYKDAYGQLIQVDEYLGENTYSTKYEYNLLGKITKITDSQNNVRNFTYDKLGRLTTQEEMHDPEAEEFGVWTMEYDEASNLTSKTDPKNQTVNYTYDGLNRILTEDYTGHNGTEVIYTYDTGTYGKGHLKTASSTGAYITYTYDKWGRTTQETKTINSKYYSTSWEYGYNSLPTKITYPGSFKVWYSYNNNNLPETVRYGESAQTIVTSDPLIDDVSYSPLKQMSAIEYHNGTMVTNTYDADQAYKLTQKDTINSLDDVLQDISYNYDNVGNITQLVDSSENDLAKTLNYTYDDLYRLTVASSTLAVQGSNYHQTYSYDPIGNMTNKSDIGDYEYANTNPYQATEINNINQTYDANGNLTNDNNLIYNFNWQDRFASTTLDASTTLSMLYDYSGLRTMKQKAFDTIDTQFNPITFLNTTYYPTKLYEEELSSIQGSTSTPSSIEIRHIMFGNQTIANVKRTNYANPALTLVFSDHLGSSGIVTNSSGVLKSIYDYYPYGGERNTDETYGYATDYRFTGKELDEETNLSYFEQRYYNQGIGRFTQVDPLSFSVPVDYLLDPQQLNNYSYARNNPLTLIDPSGEKVYAVSKAIESQESGTHVFLYMVPDNPGDFGIEEGQGWIVGAYYEDENDSLKKQINAESDVSVIQNGYSDVNNKKGALKDKVEVPTPDGKTDTEFIKDIMVQYNAYQNDAAYDPFAVNGYNSNNFTTTLLVNAGVKNLSWNGNAPGIDPGYGDVMPSNYKRADGNSVPSGRGQNLSALGSYGSNRSGQNIGAKIKSATNSISNSISNGSKVIWNWLKGSKQ